MFKLCKERFVLPTKEFHITKGKLKNQLRTRGGIRTHTVEILSLLPLPFALRGQCYATHVDAYDRVILFEAVSQPTFRIQ